MVFANKKLFNLPLGNGCFFLQAFWICIYIVKLGFPHFHLSSLFLSARRKCFRVDPARWCCLTEFDHGLSWFSNYVTQVHRVCGVMMASQLGALVRKLLRLNRHWVSEKYTCKYILHVRYALENTYLLRGPS